MKTLLEKTRSLNQLLQKSVTGPVNFNEISKVLSKMMDCNTYIIGRRGKILGYSFAGGEESHCNVVEELIAEKHRFPEDYNENLLKFTETESNIKSDRNNCVFSDTLPCHFGGQISTIVPILAGGERQGTLLLAKFNVAFNDSDLVLAEYGATVVGMEILRSKTDKIEEEARKKAAVQIAIGTLSYSELEAIEHIFEELDGTEGLLIASKVADRVGITRSVIVNALRKFESAGVIESKSLGMKGTYIRILNENLLDELEKLK